MREAAGLRPHRRTAHRERRSLPRVQNVKGKTAWREASGLFGTADRRMSKLRPGCVSAMPQSMRSRPRCEAHFDRPIEKSNG